MGFHVMLVQFTLALVLSSTSTANRTATVIAKPGCPDRCGNVSIPYPFGTTKGCYLNEQFLITCDSSSTPPKAFLTDSTINVTEISLQGQLQIWQYIARDCYDQRDHVRLYRNEPSLSLAKFTISDTNRFTAVGCDTYAIVTFYQGNETYTTGCMSICNTTDNVVNGSCSGVGCCQTPIPKGVWEIDMVLSSYYNHTNVLDFNPCSYAFVIQESEFNFTSNYLREQQNIEKLPLVVDWTIGNETCEVAKMNFTSYACKNNSNCYEPNTTSGYLCHCLVGYDGNPYLPNGCQDIDECEDPSLNNCTYAKGCSNTIGNYTCTCPKGYHGKGRKDGDGCVADHGWSLVIKFAVGIFVGIVLLVISSSWLYLGLKKRKLLKLKERFFQQNGGFMLRRQLSGPEGSNDTIKIFTAEEVEAATNNYEESRIIGQGGYGTVYKGYLTDNSIVAIKKSKIVDQTQIEQFINEVVVLSKINHRNVVRLLGCCLETQVPLLVYEFINNGTLFDHIHNKINASTLLWDTRLRIAAETAGVLSYLHSAASTPIIHRDIKSTNILLDENYIAKVSDFGASRLVPLDQTQLSTMVQGTLGYLDPEYLHTSQLTEKSDVYSFGVVLIELLTGQKALSFDRPEEQRNLAMYFISSVKEDRLFQVLEDHLLREGNTEQLKEVAMLAKRCLNVKGEDRPSMKEVAMELEGLRLMTKHPWVKAELNTEETESLLGKRSDVCVYTAGTSTTNTGSDSMIELIILPVAGGR